MRFCVLGVVQAFRGGAEVVIPGARLRTLLAALLLRPDQVVPTDQLLYDVWGEDLPTQPRSAVQAAASRLRRLLPGVELVHEYGGYRLDLEGHELDLVEFRAAVAAAASAEPRQRVALLADALRDQDGSVLRGASTGTLAERLGQSLHDEWLDAGELLGEALVATGAIDDALSRLFTITTDSPLRERSWYLLLTALQRAGRTAEALSVYDKVRHLLAEELGADPGPELQALHQELLAGNAISEWVSRTRLPLPISGFVGRDDELAAAVSWLTNPDGMPVLVLSGLPGVGKTSLAVRIGHALQTSYGDGQWLVRMRGRRADDVLAELLGYCGVGPERIPATTEAQAELFRAALARRRVLLILDDAESAAAVEALLPSTLGCAAVVTSRHALGGLAVTAGAQHTMLGPLTAKQSHDFLVQTLGQVEAVTELASLCAGLPLALRIAAMSARSLPADKLTSYSTRLKTQDRLDGLSRPVGDQGVRESFDLSYDALPARLRHLLALLGLHPGPDFGPEVTAALLGSTVDIATADLAGLAEASLLIRTDVDRYRFHDLIREYAAGLVPDDREAAEIRMLDWYLHSSFAGMSQLYTTRFGDYLSPPAPGITPQHLTDDAAVYDWFQTEWSNLIPLPSWAADHGYLSHAWQLPATFWSYLNTRRRWQDHRALYAAAAAAARSQGSVAGESWMLGNLGSAQLYVGDVAGAVESQREARRLSHLIGDNAGEAADICNLGMAVQRQGDLAGAVDLFRSALDVEPSRPGRAATLVNLSDALRNLGALDEARETATEACRIYRETGQGFSLAFAEGNVGEACLALGELDAASAHLSECLAIARAYDAVSLEAEATAVIALVHEAAGDLPKAYRTAAEARALLAGSGTPEAEAIKSRISHLTG